MSNEEVAARIAAKRRGESVDDLQPEPLVADFWEPDEGEVELHRERGRRISAERHARHLDQQSVVATAMEHFAQHGIDDPQETFRSLQIVHQAGGQEALDAVLAWMEEEVGADGLEHIEQHANEVNQHAAYQDQVNAQAQQQQHQEAIDALDRRVTEQHRKLLGDPALHASLEMIQSLAGTGQSPYDETEDLGRREELWRNTFALGRDLASHRQVMEKKLSIMDNAGRLGGEDPSQPTAMARAESFRRLGYLDSDYEWDTDASWEPEKTATHVAKTQDEIRDEHDYRRWELREALDHPGGYPHDHPLGESLTTTESDFPADDGE